MPRVVPNFFHWDNTLECNLRFYERYYYRYVTNNKATKIEKEVLTFKV